MDGTPALCLRDPQGLTDRVLFLPLAAAEILRHLDGTNSILDVQAAWVRRHGDLLFREQVEERPNRIGIDTGAYATGILTCLMLQGTRRDFLHTL